MSEKKTNVSQVEDLISTAMARANTSAAQGTGSSETEESVNRKVVELRDSTMREKNLIIHGIEESIRRIQQQEKPQTPAW
jgi:hypothetical protein